MFAPTREQTRLFLAGSWRKLRAGEPLSPLESLAAEIIAKHPEYHALLADADRHLDRDWKPERGETNPFLHLSLHLAVAEQLSIDQPSGIRAQFERLRALRGDEHDALHDLVECLGEAIWQSQRTATPLDAAVYLGCVERQR
jgi:hypothetical protein